ncbi:MAG: ParB/RepB/Spo0J family partition protein [Micromonosporaceae bacterium]|nr:ParB/RepB/Spo0J family partition protein [Micromonosporaceae bacterium]
MARRGGLKTNPLAILEDEEQRQEQATVAAAQAAGATIADLPIGIVAPDPENPESRLTPDAEFVNSIKVEGQLQPGVVVPLDVWTSYGNDITSLERLQEAGVLSLADIKYVIVYGHRRWAGCRDAGRPTYKAVITDTVKDRVTQVVHRLVENIHREDVKPLDEARDFRRLMSEGLSQHEIARRTGRNQSHISRRVGLLGLPEDARTALETDLITVEVAVELARLGKDTARIADVIDRVRSFAMPEETEGAIVERARAERTRFARAQVDSAVVAHEAERNRQAKRTALRKDGVTVIDDIREYFADRPHPRYRYQLHGDDAITAAREAGTAAAYVYGAANVEWYTTQEPADPEPVDIPTPRSGTNPTPTQTPESDEQRQAREAREHEERAKATAAEARAAACARIAAKAPSRDTLTARLARRLLTCDDIDNPDAQALTLHWLRAAAVVDDTATVNTLFRSDHRFDAKTLARIAYVYDLALAEARVRDSYGWDAEDADHIERLINETGYQPTEWEQTNLTDAVTQ